MDRRQADAEWEQHWRRIALPMPEACAPLPYEESFTAEESALLRRCVLPDVMEDKWMIFEDDYRLKFHRSWTGFCVYAVTLVNINEDEEPDRFITCEPVVNRDPHQYTCTDDAHDARLLSWLIRTLLLHQQVEFPVDPALSPGDALLSMWGSAGNAAFFAPGADASPGADPRPESDEESAPPGRPSGRL